MKSDRNMDSLATERGEGGGASERATFLRFDISPPLTPPNSPTASGPLRSALRRALSVGQADKRGHGPLVPSIMSGGGGGAEMGDSSATTPMMSHLPSSANLMALEKEEGATVAQTGRKGAVSCLSRLPLLLLLLYGFVCSLDLLTTSFRLMAGKASGMLVDFLSPSPCHMILPYPLNKLHPSKPI